MSHSNPTTNTLFEQYFEDRLAKVEATIIPWARRAFYQEDWLTHDQVLQDVRIALWRRFSEDPEGWAAKPTEKWIAYARVTFRWQIVQFHRDGNRKLGMVASDLDCMAEERDITDDEALSMVYTDHTEAGRFAHPRDIHLAELRIDLEAAIQRGLRRLCASQRRDMPLLLSDMLEGYTLEETCERHGWTRNRGVTLMRKLRTVFYEEMTGEKKTGYLGSHHPLTEAEKQRIRELYATGLTYAKVGALVGRSKAAVESVCKKYPPELVAQVRELLHEGLSQRKIARRLKRGTTYINWLVQAELRGDDDLAAVAVGA